MNKRTRILFVSVASMLTILAFQNCAKPDMKFNYDVEAAYQSIGELPSNAKTIDFQPEESVEYPSTQLILIVDNSQTMKQSQEELASRIDGLLDSMSTKKVAVRIFSTSSYLNSSSGTFYGTGKSGTDVYVNSAADLSPTDTHAFSGNLYGANPTAIILNPQDPVQTRQQAVDKVKQQVLAQGTSGSDNESGLCSLIQWVNNKYQKTEANEKVVFFVLTDEDNYRVANHCRRDLTYNYQYAASVNYKKTYIFYTYEVTGYRDGVTTNIETRSGSNVYNIAKGVDTTGLNGQTCGSADNQTLTSLVNSWGDKNVSLSGVTMHVNSAKLTSCKYFEGSNQWWLEVGDVGVDYCVQPYKGYANIMKYLSESSAGGYGVSGTQPCAMNPATWVRRGIYQNSPIYFSGAGDLASQFLAEMAKSTLKGNYFMAVVANKHGQSCELNVGASYGDVFESLEALSPGTVQTYSICKNDDGYKQAFDKISASVSYVSQEFPLVVPEGLKLRDVMILHANGPTEKIPKDQYEVIDGKIKFSLKLLKTDKLTAIFF